MAFTFRETIPEDCYRIWKWRTKHRVSRHMISDLQSDDYAKHKEWFDRSNQKTHYYHWIIQFRGIPIGLINLSDYSPDHNLTSWGFYIGNDEHVGIGGMVPPYFYNWVFTNLPIEKIQAEVMESNSGVIALHDHHGYLRAPCFDRYIIKNGIDKKLIYMWLDKAMWFNKKEFSSFQRDFPICNWEGRIK
jgi:UDP-4-amino-4,6-dideoxy-N-acetyl-beta-L-altrosamine N-acetyltransferase